MAKTPLGRLDLSAFGTLEIPRLERGVLDAFRALGDLTGTTSDALDECRIAGVVPASILRPADPAARVVGQAITVLNTSVPAFSSKTSGLADIEAHNLAEPGDVLVVQGIANVSSMGGVSASVGKRQGEAGAIVDGAVRDIDHSRKIGYPVWCSSVSPVTGKSRIRTVAIMSSLGRESYRASRLRFACAFLGDQTFDRIEDDGELLVVFLLESLDLAREMAVRIHQAP